MSHFKTFIPVLIFSLIGCQSPKNEKISAKPLEEVRSDLKGSFLIGGAYALYPLMVKLANDFMTIHPGVRIEVNKTGTGEGITGLLSKTYQLAMISRSLTNEEINAGLWVIPVAKDGVAPIVNQKNPYIEKLLDQGLSPEEFLKIFTSYRKKTWGEILEVRGNDQITVYTRTDESGAADIWANFLYKKSSELMGIGVSGDDEMIKSIQNDPLGIGYCNFSYAFDLTTGERKKDIQIVPADLDFDNKIDREESVPFINIEEGHRSLWLGFYPDDLCRELTLGSLGKPSNPLIKEFLIYVLNEGQKTVKKEGLCPLNNINIKYALERLKE